MKLIGRGINGSVYEMPNGTIVKYSLDTSPIERNTLKRLQGTHIVPRLLGHEIQQSVPLRKLRELLGVAVLPTRNLKNPNLSVLRMSKVGDMTLYEYLQKFPKADRKPIKDRIFHLIEDLHVRGVSHGDLHANNIRVSADAQGRITGMWVIDFGRARRIPLGKPEIHVNIGKKPNSKYPTANIFNPKRSFRVPVHEGSRSNLHMQQIHYGIKVNPERLRRLLRLRREIAYLVGNAHAPPMQSSSPVRGASRRALSAPPRTSV